MSSSYKKDISEHHKNAKISFIDLIETLVILYGNTNEEGIKYLSEIKLDSILDDILSREEVDLAYFIMNTPYATEKLNWHYDSGEGKGYITEV